MKKIRKIIIASLLACIPIVTFIVFLWLMYKSGCAGDMKTGAYGNIEKALEIENKAFTSLFASTICIFITYIVVSKAHMAVRILSGVGISIIYFLFALFTGGSLQGEGGAICNS